MGDAASLDIQWGELVAHGGESLLELGIDLTLNVALAGEVTRPREHGDYLDAAADEPRNGATKREGIVATVFGIKADDRSGVHVDRPEY
jgi:hypothetical protein